MDTALIQRKSILSAHAQPPIIIVTITVTIIIINIIVNITITIITITIIIIIITITITITITIIIVTIIVPFLLLLLLQSLLHHQVEVLFVLCALCGGKQKQRVQRLLAELGLVDTLALMFENLDWSSPPTPPGDDPHVGIHGPGCACNPHSVR